MDPTSPNQTPSPTAPLPPPTPSPATKNNKLIKLALVGAAVLVAIIIIAAVLAATIFSKKDPSSTKQQNTNQTAEGRQALPADFPRDVPLYEGVVTAADKANFEGKPGWTVTITTNNTIANVAPALSGSFTSEGWTTTLNNSTTDRGMIDAKKGNIRVNVIYIIKDGQTHIVYSVTNDES